MVVNAYPNASHDESHLLVRTIRKDLTHLSDSQTHGELVKSFMQFVYVVHKNTKCEAPRRN